MKKSLFILLTLVAHSALADIRSQLRAHQRTLGATSTSGTTSSGPRSGIVASGPAVSSTSQARCEETRQTSIPLSNLLDLVQDASPTLTVEHDPRPGILTISSPNMIGNCNSMLDVPIMTPKQFNGSLKYAIEVKFKKGEDCRFVKDAAGNDTDVVQDCSYKVMKKTGEDLTSESLLFEPSLAGFRKCLVDSGVVKNDALNTDGIYPQPFRHSIDGVKDSGTVVFQSRGPSVTQGAAFGNFIMNDGCDYYENITAEPAVLFSAAEIESRSLDQKAQQLAECSIADIEELTRFIAENPTFSFLKDHQEKLLTEAAKSVAAVILKDKFSDEDLKIFDYFKNLVVIPRANALRQMYADIQAMPAGAAKTAKTAEFNKLKKELAALNASPYFTQKHVEKLLGDGYFDAGEKLFDTRLVTAVYAKLGDKIGKDAVNNVSAEEIITDSRTKFGSDLVTVKERYEVRTGQSTGQSESYTQNADDLRVLAAERQQEYQALIQQERAAAAQCQSQFWRTQACLQDAAQAVQDLTAAANEDLEADKKEIDRLERKALEYAELERQGRVFQAEQNGEQVAKSDRKPVKSIKRTRQPSEENQTQAQLAQQQQQQAAILAYQQQLAQQQAQMWQMQMGQGQASQYPMNSGAGFNFGFNLGGTAGGFNPFGQQQMMGQPGFSPYAQQQSMGFNPLMGQQPMGFNPFGQQQQPGFSPYSSPYSGMQQGYNPMQYSQPGYGLFGGGVGLR